jgi:hypothetical protein
MKRIHIIYLDNVFKIKFNLLAIGLLFLLSCCTYMPAKKSSEGLPDQGPVLLELAPGIGYVDETYYQTSSLTQIYSGPDIIRKISNSSHFNVETKVIRVDKENKLLTLNVSTISKEGNIDLDDFALPQEGESLEVVLTQQGIVTRVSQMPPGTLYYVPPISLPKAAVRVGETWEMTAEWINSKNGMPLKMEVVSTLASLHDCKDIGGVAGICAIIDISGNVSISGLKREPLFSKTTDKIKFKSEISGRLIFSIKNGTVLFSYTKDQEQLMGEKDRVDISSCTISYVTKPIEESLLLQKLFSIPKSCIPAEALPNL